METSTLLTTWGQPRIPQFGADRPKTMMAIALEVAAKTGFTVAELISPRRDRALVRARWEAMDRCRQETSASYPQIGGFFGGRDHTSILYAVRRHKALMGLANAR